MDIASIGGILLAVVGILAGMMIEGGNLAQITKPTAAMIVIGGTAGAVMLQFPMAIFLAAIKSLLKVFLHKGADGEAILQQIVSFANKARKEGIVSLDADLGNVEDPFLKQALMLAGWTAPNPANCARSCSLSWTISPRLKKKFPLCLKLPEATRRP